MLYLTTTSILILTFNKFYKISIFPWTILVNYVIINIVHTSEIRVLDGKFLYVIVLELMYTNVVVNHISGLMFGHILNSTFINLIT